MTDAAYSGSVETAYVNGNVVTVDRKFSVAEAFVIGGGRFIAVGRSESIIAQAGSGATVVDLDGLTVLPGFIDTHAHAIHRGVASATRLSLEGLSSVEAIVRRIREQAEAAEPGAWIVTTPIGKHPDYFHLPESLSENRWPTRADLDQATVGHPVCIPTEPKWPHPAVFNTLALAQLGVTRDTADEPSVRIIRDADGEPTGVIYGLSMHNKTSSLYQRLLSVLPGAQPDQQEAGIARALDENLAAGVTSIYEGHGNYLVPVLKSMNDCGGLANRVVSAYEVPTGLPIADIDRWMAERGEAAGSGTGDNFHKVIGATVSMDGAIQWGKALMRQPYLDPFGEPTNGTSAVSMEKLIEIAQLAARHDLRLNIQAAGDLACEMAVQAMEAVDSQIPISSRRWVVQHFQHPSRAHIAALARLGVVVQTYSSVDFSKGADVYVGRLGGDRWQSVVPLRWWIDGGVTVAGSSDGGHYDPMFQIWESLVRVDGRTGQSLLAPPKQITRTEAIQIYTINGAHVLGWEDRLGSIETGKLADFVVLDHDILRCPVDEIRGTEALVTVLNGTVRHDVRNAKAAR